MPRKGSELVIPALVAIGVLICLGIFAGVDPARGVTFSESPFTDEGWNALDSRNLVLLGRWSTDEWQLYLVHLPYSALLALWFVVFGVGIIQQRMLSIVLVGLTAGLLAWGVDRIAGRLAGLVASVAFAGSALILYYGRLGYGEDLANLALVAGAFALVVPSARPRMAGLIAGVALGIAVLTKQNAAFAAAGCLVGSAAVGGARDPTWRQRAAWAVLAAAMVGGSWALVAAPNFDGLRIAATQILPAIQWPGSLAAVAAALRAYLHGSDGALAMLAPVGVAALLGGLVLVLRRRSLTYEQRLLTGMAAAWAVLALGVVAIASYHPNRYVLPVVPALAVLAGLGASALVSTVATQTSGPGPRWTTGLAGVGLATLLATPGSASFAGWMAEATTTLPTAQAAWRDAIPPGALAAGSDAPLLLMSAPVTTIVTNCCGAQPVNAGDLYATRGVRWFVDGRGATPAVAHFHPEAWAAREVIRCDSWPPDGHPVCLYRLP